jgi:hypothetical protein
MVPQLRSVVIAIDSIGLSPERRPTDLNRHCEERSDEAI